jgi:hypothetical protein
MITFCKDGRFISSVCSEAVTLSVSYLAKLGGHPLVAVLCHCNPRTKTRASLPQMWILKGTVQRDLRGVKSGINRQVSL